MKRNIFLTFGLIVAIFLGFVIQEFIPPLGIARGARVYFTPVFFCFGACILPFPCMILLALVAGFLSDFTTLQIVERSTAAIDLDAIRNMTASVEISPGTSILLFVAFGLICQGVRPLVLHGQWWLPPILSAGMTITYLALQFLFITMRRFNEDGLFWSETVVWRIFTPGLVAFGLTILLMPAMMFADRSFFSEHRRIRNF